jgi:hypothetical protein
MSAPFEAACMLRYPAEQRRASDRTDITIFQPWSQAMDLRAGDGRRGPQIRRLSSVADGNLAVAASISTRISTRHPSGP